MYREIGKDAGLVEGDIESIGMGQSGVDIILSPRAQGVFHHAVECKKHKRVAVPTHFAKHFAKYKDTPALKLLFHENDRSEALVTMQAKDFMAILGKIIQLEKDK